MKKLLLALLVLTVGLTMTASIHADEVTLYKINNRWLDNAGMYLYESGGKVAYAHFKEGDETYLWSLEDKGGYQLIKNKATGNYVVLKAGTPEVDTTATVDAADANSQWGVDTVAGDWKSIQSLANKNYINLEGQTGFVTCDLAQTPSDKDRWSAQWKFAYVSGPPPPHAYQRNMVSVTAPAYCSDVQGDTTVTIVAPGLTSAEVKCWQAGPGFGADSTVTSVTLDAAGKGSFVFPADKYPHGPLTVRIIGTNGSATDTCNLQLYNKGGVSWNEGIPKSDPPAAAGMKLVFQDDFDKPLSISRDGQGATYASHKPGGGDFGALHFADFESPDNPFTQVDTYLRIRANANKGTTGLISALKMDGTGLTVTAPFYFECRFIAQSAPGSWPAFWIMTQPVYKGLSTPADEMDIIEGYGGFGPHNPNQIGYWVTSHNWNQPGKQPGVYKQIEMTKLDGGSPATWWESFHTFGCKITDTDTIYYCDNVEVARHPTATLSKTDPYFFFINLAVGGNGWPMDLSRYDGVIDMYVDYVRVYKG